MPNFDFLEKSLEIVSPAHFVYGFPNFIAWFPLLPEILVNMCIAIVYSLGCDVTNFEDNLIFLIKSFFYMAKKSRQTFKYLENENSF